jgi:hypothetical protein
MYGVMLKNIVLWQPLNRWHGINSAHKTENATSELFAIRNQTRRRYYPEENDLQSRNRKKLKFKKHLYNKIFNETFANEAK